jgi:hypothetical protein
VQLINCNSVLRFVVTNRLARHSAGSQTRSAAPRPARPPSFARWRACGRSLSLTCRHSACALARTRQLLPACTGGSSSPAARLWPYGHRRTLADSLSAAHSYRSSSALRPHGQHTDSRAWKRHTIRTSPPQEPHIKATAIP